ncbi:uncharacterized protein LOC126734230 [Anthonomus grandis grandis]|uniref:uncharacterized protein LOC126734230 n=1 Tax=Anthonomus grandis grandis TaxID=2921223 RepID=UPI002165FE22|nr:uncharacterized protein LOC126734230 [Anthonomus grandis grandis]
MSTTTFDELNVKLEFKLIHKNVVRLSISATERLCVALRYLASGNTFTDLRYTYRLGISTISTVVEEVSIVIWTLLKDECMGIPSTKKWENISMEFEELANFPNCIGAVDGKHIRIIKPTKSGSLFFNYKHFFSVLLLAVCDRIIALLMSMLEHMESFLIQQYSKKVRFGKNFKRIH